MNKLSEYINTVSSNLLAKKFCINYPEEHEIYIKNILLSNNYPYNSLTNIFKYKQTPRDVINISNGMVHIGFPLKLKEQYNLGRAVSNVVLISDNINKTYIRVATINSILYKSNNLNKIINNNFFNVSDYSNNIIVNNDIKTLLQTFCIDDIVRDNFSREQLFRNAFINNEEINEVIDVTYELINNDKNKLIIKEVNRNFIHFVKSIIGYGYIFVIGDKLGQNIKYYSLLNSEDLNNFLGTIKSGILTFKNKLVKLTVSFSSGLELDFIFHNTIKSSNYPSELVIILKNIL